MKLRYSLMTRKETRPGNIIKAAAFVSVAAGFGLAGIKSWELGSEIGNHFKHDNNQSYSQRLENLEAYYGLSRGDINTKGHEPLIGAYKTARDSFSALALYDLQTNNNQETKDFIENGRKELLLDGAGIFSLLAADKEIVEIGENEDWIEIGGIKFDLADSYQALLLGSVIDESIAMYTPSTSEVDAYDAKERRGDLLWLSHEELPVKIENEAWGFAPRNVFVNMSRFYQKVKALGYPIPRTMIFQFYNPGDPGGGWYSPDVNDLYVTNHSGDDTIIHEWSHNQADESPEFSQKNYNDTFFNEEVWDKAFSPDSFINPGVLGKKNHAEVMVEDYAENLSIFFTNGTEYRQRLKKLFLAGNPSYELLLAKYYYAQKFYGGDEFLTNGERFLPIKGDIFVINDPDGFYRGICLRSEPSYDFEEAPKVYDEELVEVLEGPVEAVDPSGSGTRQMYRVMFVQYDQENHSKRVYLDNGEGWIWKIWLGDRIIPSRVSNDLLTINYLIPVHDEACY